jgi:serine/threonine protein phosphatase PrpC
MKVDSEFLPVETAADSDVGRVRTNNEDSYALVRFECGGRPSVLALVADGVGGHVAGEIASQTVVDEISARLQADPCADPVQSLPLAAVNASRAVYARTRQNPELRGMATTLAAVWLIGRRLFTVTVGDSRIYLHRAGKTFQASVDHTWVQEAIERGLLTPAQAKIHPNAHVLRRHLGGEKDPQPDLRLRGEEDARASTEHQGLVLEGGDAAVLCSDGLSDLVNTEEIGRALRHRDLEKSVHELIELARERGGHDNITVAVLRAAGPPGARGEWLRPLILVVLSALALALVTTLIYLLIFTFG